MYYLIFQNFYRVCVALNPVLDILTMHSLTDITDWFVFEFYFIKKYFLGQFMKALEFFQIITNLHSLKNKEMQCLIVLQLHMFIK